MGIVEEKVQSLPPVLQQEIMDFIDFVTVRYQKSKKNKSLKKRNLGTKGKPITELELKERIAKSEQDIKNQKILTLKEAKLKVKSWK